MTTSARLVQDMMDAARRFDERASAYRIAGARRLARQSAQSANDMRAAVASIALLATMETESDG